MTIQISKEAILQWWNTWKVFIIGMLTSTALAVQEYMKAHPNQDPKVYIYAGAIALLSFVGNAWRGKGMSILGIVGTASAVIALQLSHPPINWFETITAILAAIYAVAAPNPVTQKIDDQAKQTVASMQNVLSNMAMEMPTYASLKKNS